MLEHLHWHDLLQSRTCRAQWFDCYEHAEFGDVFFGLRGSYPDSVLHSFANTAPTDDTLVAGTTHVAVGFLDLSQLSCALVQPACEGSDGPLRWVSYDSSAYSVATSHVRFVTCPIVVTVGGVPAGHLQKLDNQVSAFN